MPAPFPLPPWPVGVADREGSTCRGALLDGLAPPVVPDQPPAVPDPPPPVPEAPPLAPDAVPDPLTPEPDVKPPDPDPLVERLELLPVVAYLPKNEVPCHGTGNPGIVVHGHDDRPDLVRGRCFGHALAALPRTSHMTPW